MKELWEGRQASMSLVEGKVALVTGGASGNGRATAITLARNGAAAVVVADVRDTPREGGRPTHELITAETDATAEFAPVDLARDINAVPAGVPDVVTIGDRLGGIDILINNAGVYWAEDFFDVPPSHYDRMMNINVRGPYFLTQKVAKGMVNRGAGCIVNVTSGSGIVGSARRSLYGASKGALQVLTYALAAELGPLGIRVNAVSPGSIRTAMTTQDVPYLADEAATTFAEQVPLRRVGEPDDVANAILFLCSDLASFINGTSFEVDGGELRAINRDH